MGFNVKKLQAEIIVNVPFLDDSIIRMRHIKPEKYKEIRQRCTTVKYNAKTHQREEEVDSDLFCKELAEESVVGWDLKDGDADFPCNTENRAFMVNNSADFRLLVFDVPLSLEKMLAIEREEERKNSANGGAQG